MTAMNSQTERRLYQIGQLPDVLQLSAPQIDWLVATGQLRTIRIGGETRVDSNEVNQLIETYNQIAKRKLDHVQ
jgi:predicted DNA-binding transcriptional regulator AlpA